MSWECIYSVSTNKRFYHNTETGETTWLKPPGLGDACSESELNERFIKTRDEYEKIHNRIMENEDSQRRLDQKRILVNDHIEKTAREINDNITQLRSSTTYSASELTIREDNLRKQLRSLNNLLTQVYSKKEPLTREWEFLTDKKKLLSKKLDNLSKLITSADRVVRDIEFFSLDQGKTLDSYATLLAFFDLDQKNIIKKIIVTPVSYWENKEEEAVELIGGFPSVFPKNLEELQQLLILKIDNMLLCIQGKSYNNIGDQTKEAIEILSRVPMFIGTGSFGCFYNPALECDDGRKIAKGYSTKRTNLKEGNDAIRIANLLQPIDPELKYFLYSKQGDQCTSRYNENSSNIYEIDKCKVTGKRDSVLLIMKNGGESLHKFQLKPIENMSKLKIFKTALLSLRNIIDGVQILHENRLFHSDIKPANLVIETTNVGIQTRIIDFDYLIPLFADLSSPIIRYKRNYDYWPFEIKFLTSNYDKSNISESLSEWLEFKKKTVSFMSSLFENYDVSQLEYSLNHLYDYSRSTDLSFMRGTLELICKKSDIHALGISFSYFFTRLTGLVLEDGKIIIQKTKTDIATLPITSDYRKIEKVSFEWLSMCNKMAHLDIFKRFDMDELISYFDNIMVPTILE